MRSSEVTSPAQGRVADPAPARAGKVPPVVFLLAAVTFLTGTTELIVAGLLPQMATAFAVSVSHAGLLITVFALGMMLGAPVMALATLRLSRRWALVLALLVFVAAHAVAALSPSFGVVLAARFFAAVATGTFWAVGSVVAAAAAGPAAGARAIAVMVSGFTVANIVGVPLGAAAGQALGWQGPFWVLAVLALLAAGLLARQLPADTGGGDTTLRAELGGVARGRVWLIYLANALVQAAVLAAYSYVAPLLTDRAGLPAALVPLVMLGYGVGALAGTTVGGRRGDRRPFATAIPAAACIAAVLAALTLWATSSVAATVLIVALGFFGLAINPIVVSQIVHTAGPAHTLAVALGTSSFNVGIAVGSWLGGLALASRLGTQGPSLVGTGLAVLGVIALAALALTGHRTTASSAGDGAGPGR